MHFRSAGFVIACSLLLPNVCFSLDTREIFKIAEPSVVVVLAADAKGEKNSLGSGVIIAPLEIVTSCRVVESAADIVVTQDSALRKAKLQFYDKERDLCRLHIEEPLPSGKPAAVNASSSPLEAGQDVFAISSPRGLERTINRTMISGLHEKSGTGGRLIQVDAHFAGGSIGGGLFDQNAKLVGIVTPQFRQGEESTYALPAEWIAELAQRNPDRLLAVTAPKEATATATASAAARAEPVAAWMPRVGDRWKYKLIDGKRPVGTVVVEIVEARDKFARERITREDDRKFIAERSVDAEFNPLRFQEVITHPGGFQLAEISPYAPGGDVPKLHQSWPDMPLSLMLTWVGKHKFLMHTKVIRKETVRVPAGQFDATLIEAGANENMGTFFVKVTCKYWYAAEVKRSVKMSLQIEYSLSAINSNAEIYELMAFEPAK